jgi:hypothetical protein
MPQQVSMEASLPTDVEMSKVIQAIKDVISLQLKWDIIGETTIREKPFEKTLSVEASGPLGWGLHPVEVAITILLKEQEHKIQASSRVKRSSPIGWTSKNVDYGQNEVILRLFFNTLVKQLKIPLSPQVKEIKGRKNEVLALSLFSFSALFFFAWALSLLKYSPSSLTGLWVAPAVVAVGFVIFFFVALPLTMLSVIVGLNVLAGYRKLNKARGGEFK